MTVKTYDRAKIKNLKSESREKFIGYLSRIKFQGESNDYGIEDQKRFLAPKMAHNDLLWTRAINRYHKI